MDILKLKNDFFQIWSRYFDQILIVGLVIIVFYALYNLMLFLEKRNDNVAVFHEKLSGVINVLFNIWARLFALLIFLISVIILVSIVVKVIMFVWSL